MKAGSVRPKAVASRTERKTNSSETRNSTAKATAQRDLKRHDIAIQALATMLPRKPASEKKYATSFESSTGYRFSGIGIERMSAVRDNP
jgi:hypothetical protein